MTLLPSTFDALRLPKPLSRDLAVMVARIAAIIFLVEVLIMLFLSGWELTMPVVEEGLLDGTMLTVFSTPMIYIWVARPFAEAARTARAELVEQLAQTRRLLDQNERLRVSLQRMSESAADTNERILQKIGADLHDGPAQMLAFSLLKLDRLAPGLERAGEAKGLAELERLRGHIAATLQEVRGISTGLALPELGSCSLEETIRLAVMRHEEATGARVAVSIDALPARSSQTQRACIYRVLQEALSNAFRHADARAIRVAACGKPELTVTIADDGRGFDAATRHENGLGITGMRARLQAIGGRLEIESAPGAGTSIVAHLDPRP